MERMPGLAPGGRFPGVPCPFTIDDNFIYLVFRVTRDGVLSVNRARGVIVSGGAGRCSPGAQPPLKFYPMDFQTRCKTESILSPGGRYGSIEFCCSWNRQKSDVYWSGGWGCVVVGVRPSEGVRIGCRRRPGLVECEVHLRTLSPAVCMNRGLWFGGETGGGGVRGAGECVRNKATLRV